MLCVGVQIHSYYIYVNDTLYMIPSLCKIFSNETYTSLFPKTSDVDMVAHL